MRIAPIAVALGAVLVACSGNIADANGRDANGTDANHTCPQAGDLATVGEGCAATYNGSEANLPACPAPVDIRFPVERGVWRCQDLFIVWFGSALASQVCYYDASSYALVGAQSRDPGCDDQPIDGVEAGRTNLMCIENAPLVDTHQCPLP
jgi:hypothetical protein